jgi:hypothetical protein
MESLHFGSHELLPIVSSKAGDVQKFEKLYFLNVRNELYFFLKCNVCWGVVLTLGQTSTKPNSHKIHVLEIDTCNRFIANIC